MNCFTFISLLFALHLIQIRYKEFENPIKDCSVPYCLPLSDLLNSLMNLMHLTKCQASSCSTNAWYYEVKKGKQLIVLFLGEKNHPVIFSLSLRTS